MKKRIYHFISLIAVALILGTACTNEVADEYPVEDSFLTINLSMGKLTTRAISTEDGIDDLNENKINSIDIFFYQGNTLKWRVSSLSYDQGTGKATIPVPANKVALLDGTTVYNIYVVANNTASLTSINEDADNLDALKNIVFQTSDFVSKGGFDKQTSFVMDGVILNKSVNLNNPDLGTVDMKRAAAKIRLQLINVNVPGYTQDGDATARLVHFTDKSALMDGGALQTGDWKETSARALATAYGTNKTTAYPFYAYANDWSQTSAYETYIELYVPLKENLTGGGFGDVQTFKYRVPVTPRGLTGDDVQYMNKIHRNFLYDISVAVNILGSREEPPIAIDGNYIIKDWSTQQVLVDITGAHYLVVSERNVLMPNISSYVLNFNSSIPNVTLVPGSLKATFTYINNSGVTVTENVASNQQPTVTVQPNVAAGTITISSPIPVNYIPKDIEFKVTNGQLTEIVVIRQLPATYFTVTKGVESAHYANYAAIVAADLNNPYMYAITSLAPSGNDIWGFPPVDSQGRTINSEEVSKMISPKFEMASQFGASLPKSYSEGQDQCRVYWEKAEDGTIKTGWRLPTAAEIHYIDVIQQTAPSEYVMRGRYYWSSWNQYPNPSSYGTGAYRMGINVPAKNHTDSYSNQGTVSRAYVRCIRDIKD